MLSIERSEREHGDKKLSIYICRLIESNNARLIAFGEERIGRKGLTEKGWENLFRQLDQTTVANRVIRIVGECAFSLILIFAQPVGMDNHTWHWSRSLCLWVCTSVDWTNYGTWKRRIREKIHSRFKNYNISIEHDSQFVINYYPEMIFIHLSFILIRKQTDLSIHSVEISQPKTRENIQTKLNNI